MSILRALRRGWMTFAHILGRIQTTLLLSFVYFIIVGVIGMIGRAFGRGFLELRRSKSSSYWVALPRTTTTLEQARKQF